MGNEKTIIEIARLIEEDEPPRNAGKKGETTQHYCPITAATAQRRKSYPYSGQQQLATPRLLRIIHVSREMFAQNTNVVIQYG